MTVHTSTRMRFVQKHDTKKVEKVVKAREIVTQRVRTDAALPSNVRNLLSLCFRF